MIALVASNPDGTNGHLVDAWRAFGLDVAVVHPGRSVELLRDGDTAIGRIDVRRSIDGVERGLLELAELGRRGVTVLNGPSALITAHDKLRTARALHGARLPHPRTEHVTPGSPPASIGPPVVLKPRFGSWGVGIVRCETPAELFDATAAIGDHYWFRRQGALVQRLVPPAGYDLRVLVAGGRVVGSVSRVAAPGEWRTNIALGGHRRPVVAPPRAQGLALAAAATIRAGLVGVDLLPDGDDYTVIEINGAVDFDATYSLPGRDVFEDVALALGLFGGVELPDDEAADHRGRFLNRPVRTMLDGAAPAGVAATAGVVQPGA
jgi:ribosomal protein S6--L-glutamate ligase